MGHLYAKARNSGHRLAAKHMKRGGAVLDGGAASGEGRLEKTSATKADQTEQDLKATGKRGRPRLDKKARGGGFMGMPKRRGIRAPKGPKAGGHTYNMIIMPHGGAPDGAPSDGAPLVPEEPMAPPTSKLGAGTPGLGIRRGGKTTRKSTKDDDEADD